MTAEPGTTTPSSAELPGLADVLGPAAELYLDVHRHPELSGVEARTAGRFAERLASDGYEVTRGVGGHGVVGVLRNGPGPVVLLRAELDALPVREDTGLPYASAVTAPRPVMHACGHDMHLACLSGAAALLSRTASGWSGTLVVVGQPAEETLTGAAAMLADGLYRRFPAPGVVLAQHTVPLPAGMVAHGDGPVLAAGATVEVVLHGRGGHAGAPQLAVDPVVAAAALVLRLQTVVSRETGPGEPLVLTVGRLHAGGAGNVIPDRAELEVTLRAFAPETLDRALAAVHRIVHAEAAASGSGRAPGIRVVNRSGTTVNDPEAATAVRRAHEDAFGAGRVARWQPSTATEDFPLLGPAGRDLHGVAGIRTCYWMLGAVGPEQWAAAGATAAERLAAVPGNHSPRFRPHVGLTLRTGVRALSAAALTHLAAPAGSVKVASQTPSAVEG
ncbi:hippurate hydrolase [Actinacidiphila rubida]|uniref:Hippurate hydrolase n=2 Tax=Actinacidiphila rubida TaxID=310780 RepID=A0A1H8RDW1_9ACTN|nr:amidohydrolase [Actinacidiphila rubida]SEO64532.1 hippurate hydrolase [Actinacidiphila rubida]